MKMTIERGKKKYIMHTKGDCGRRCSFARCPKDMEFCLDNCYLPKWFTNVIDDIMQGRKYPYLEEIKE